jgi:3D (Asp-Asp-Asp) domain-containing protein
MSKIIKIIFLTVVVLVPTVVLAKDNLQNTDNIQIFSSQKIELNNNREKLGVEVITFKTKQDEKIEKLNQKRLNIYKKRLARAKFEEGEQDILVTGYSSTPDQCWGNPFKTASGTHVHRGTMACPPQYPFGTKIKIKNLGTFICEDRGGAIKGNHFDMWFTSRKKALSWGKRTLVATISK